MIEIDVKVVLNLRNLFGTWTCIDVDGTMSNEHAIAVAAGATVAFTTATPLSRL